MEKQARKRVLAVLDDLIFTVKINEAARGASMDVDFATTDKDVLAKASQDPPALIIFDLNCRAVSPLQLISRIKSSSQTRSIRLLAYVSHVQGELKQKAQEAGCDMVLARSAFSQNLGAILRRHSGIVA